MKKFALATLLAASAMTASAQVTVTGKIAEYFDSTTKGGVLTHSVGADPTSNIAFRGEEDLGNGLKARAFVDTKILANDPKATGNTTQLGDRESTVGLANSLGSIDLGRSYHSAFNTLRFTDTFGALYASTAADLHQFRDSGRLSNGTFVKANLMPNVTASYEFSQNVPGTPDTKSYGAIANVAGLKIDASHWQSDNTTHDKTNILGLVYMLQDYRLSAIRSTDTTAGVKSEALSYGVAKPITGTPFVLKATNGKKNEAGVGDTRAYNLGADYVFSARTTAQVMYRHVNAPGTANDIKQVAVGMIHKF
jgi:predicted porin